VVCPNVAVVGVRLCPIKRNCGRHNYQKLHVFLPSLIPTRSAIWLYSTPQKKLPSRLRGALRLSFQTRTEPSTEAETSMPPLWLTATAEMACEWAFGISYTSAFADASSSFQMRILPVDVPPTAYSVSLSKHLQWNRSMISGQ
jgi:hypothetical protein